MAFVIDASVAASWLLPDERATQAEVAYGRLDEDNALVPWIWWFEMRNLFIVNERRGRIDGERTARALARLADLPIQIDDEVEETALLHLARTHRLSAYDAAYLELAQRQSIDLATLDRTLMKAARAEGIPLVA